MNSELGRRMITLAGRIGFLPGFNNEKMCDVLCGDLHALEPSGVG